MDKYLVTCNEVVRTSYIVEATSSGEALSHVFDSILCGDTEEEMKKYGITPQGMKLLNPSLEVMDLEVAKKNCPFGLIEVNVGNMLDELRPNFSACQKDKKKPKSDFNPKHNYKAGTKHQKEPIEFFSD